MIIENFIKQLNEARELMLQEKYKDAIKILEKLKEIEKNNNYNYDLIHQLYQLDSNCRSVYNQQVILNHIKRLSKDKSSISFRDLNQVIQKAGEISTSEDTLRKEVELLILRNLLTCKIEGNHLLF